MKISNRINKKRQKYLWGLLAGGLVLWLCFFLLQKTNLVTTDLGRFIKNGENMLNGNWRDILHINFYSFTHFQYPFLNHHWGTGLIFYLLYQGGGFLTLHLFALTLIGATFFLLFKMAAKEAGTAVAVLLSLILIPLMAYRREIRPEIFSCLFSALFFFVLWGYKNKTISKKWLWSLPIIEILWINLHIYFFLGPAIIGTFLLEKIIFYVKNGKEFPRRLMFVCGLTFLGALINPFGWRGIIHPFKIYTNYGYKILEEQSVWFLENLRIHNPSFLLFKIVLILLVVSFVWIAIKKREKIPWANFFLASGFGFMAGWSVRNITLFAFMSLPILAGNIKIIFPKINFPSFNKKIGLAGLSLAIIIVICLSYGRYLPIRSKTFGPGLSDAGNQAIDFFEKNNLQGPLFNNYDIGGYLIYHLSPKKKVFVDNRPEAYPAKFFQDIYIPMQNNEQVWKKQSEKYGFNAIIFFLHDATPWGQKFLIARTQDKEWAPVFADNFIIIFLKNNKLNEKVIEKYRVPREMFRIIQSE